MQGQNKFQVPKKFGSKKNGSIKLLGPNLFWSNKMCVPILPILPFMEVLGGSERVWNGPEGSRKAREGSGGSVRLREYKEVALPL